MTQESSHFYGREKELKQLFQAWCLARQGKPQWVSLVSEMGTGKTRLIQEFYRYLSDVQYRKSKLSGEGPDEWAIDFNDKQYWPRELPSSSSNLILNPPQEAFSKIALDSLKDFPWLWWAARGNGSEHPHMSAGSCAVYAAKPHLELHTHAYAAKQAEKKAYVDMLKTCGTFGLGLIPVVGQLFSATFSGRELVNAARPLVNKILRKHAPLPAVAQLERTRQITEVIVGWLSNYLNDGVPVVLVLDDAQWLDKDSLSVVETLVNLARGASLPLMIVSTCWHREWTNSSIKKEFEKFTGTSHFVTLKGIEEEHAIQILHERLPGLNDQDCEFLVGRARGNLRYLTELILLLEQDPAMYFQSGDKTRGLTEKGRSEIESKEMDIDRAVEKRFLNLDKDIRSALEWSSVQGPLFDPKLTERAACAIAPTDEKLGPTTIEAIVKAEESAAMVCEVKENLKSFLDGPYWRVIHTRYQKIDSNYKELDEIYWKIYSEERLSLDKRIEERFLRQRLLKTDAFEEKYCLRSRLLLLLEQSGRYVAALSELHALSALCTEQGVQQRSEFLRSEVEGFPKCDMPADVALAALRIFNQFAFGADRKKLGESNDEADTQNYPLERFCRDIAAPVLEDHLDNFLTNGTFPADVTENELVEWAGSLVQFSKGLGQTPYYYTKLYLLGNVHKTLSSTSADSAKHRFAYAAVLVRVAEIGQFSNEEKESQRILGLYQEAQKELSFLEEWDRDVLEARVLSSYLRHIPQNRDRQDLFSFYVRCAERLGDVLVAMEFNDQQHEGNVIQRQADGVIFTNTLFQAANLTIELALEHSFDIATEFLDRLHSLTRSTLILFQRGAYIPVSTIENAAELELTIALIMKQRLGVNETDRESTSSMSGFVVVDFGSRPITVEDATKALSDIVDIISRCEKLGMLTVDLLVLHARVQCALLDIDSARARPSFLTVLENARLAEDGLRLAYGEQGKLMGWLIRIYDKWLAEIDQDGTLWTQFRETYFDLNERKFNTLVSLYRGQSVR